MLRTLRNLTVNIIAAFIRDRDERHKFRNKYKIRSKFRKLRDDNRILINNIRNLQAELSWIKHELTKQSNEIRLKERYTTHAALYGELKDYFKITNPNTHFFFLGMRRRLKFTDIQSKYINQFNDKVANGEYKLVQNKCICGAECDELIAVRDVYGIKINTVICKKCGLIRANPYYDNSTLAQFYSEEYDHIYGRSRFSFDELFLRIRGRGEKIIAVLKENNVLLKNKTVYELGCSCGGILYEFNKIGCSVIGADYNKNLIYRGKEKGLDLRVGGVDAFKGCKPADIVILNHVLEHLTEPIETLKAIHNILKDDGILFVEVPTIEVIKRDFGSNFPGYLQNAHVFYFSTKTLIYVLECSGYSCKKVGIDRVIAKKSANIRSVTDISESEYQYAIKTLTDFEENYFSR